MSGVPRTRIISLAGRILLELPCFSAAQVVRGRFLVHIGGEQGSDRQPADEWCCPAEEARRIWVRCRGMLIHH